MISYQVCQNRGCASRNAIKAMDKYTAIFLSNRVVDEVGNILKVVVEWIFLTIPSWDVQIFISVWIQHFQLSSDRNDMSNLVLLQK